MRASGILLHISSLPSPYGIGTLGASSYEFVDFLVKSGQSYWQILPICPTSFGDSPYQSFSTFAGNPYFIDFPILTGKGYLKAEDYENVQWGESPQSVDYGLLYENRFSVLDKAVTAFGENISPDFYDFLARERHWVHDYSLFMTLKELHDYKSWLEWEPDYRSGDKTALEQVLISKGERVFFWQVVQYFFYQQWDDLKQYANKHGVKIIGDLPIYTAMDSVDVWRNTRLFLLNETTLQPTFVSGVPPDAFTSEGQLWGNPLYRWDIMEQDGYSWWAQRLAHVSHIYDITRIDHFRGFDSYYAIPAHHTDARRGEWRQGPGLAFFQKIHQALGDVPFIAEDLGLLTPSVRELVKNTGYPGMKILQFAFDSQEDSDYLPHNYEKNSTVYTGTHDNDTILGWFEMGNKEDTRYAADYFRLTLEEGYHWGMMNGAWASVADCVIVQMQDLIGLDNSARMNVPSTMGTNWKWRALPHEITDELALKTHTRTHIYRRTMKK